MEAVWIPVGRDGTHARGFWRDGTHALGVWRDGARARGVERDLKYVLYHPGELTFVAVNFLSPGISIIDSRHYYYYYYYNYYNNNYRPLSE